MAAAAATAAALSIAAAPVARADSVAVNSDAYVPGNIDSTAFYDLVAQVADRWSLAIDGPTDAVAGDRDGTDALSFTPYLGDGILGSYIYWYRHVYKVTRVKKCHRTSSGKRRCHWVKRRRFAYDLIVENDVGINSNVPWNPGPDYPSIDQYDLETVLLHELGHYADPNAPHEARCSGSPLTDSLATGEWWRDYNDWFEYGCGLGKRTVRRSTRHTRGFVVVRHKLPAVYIGDTPHKPPAAIKIIR